MPPIVQHTPPAQTLAFPLCILSQAHTLVFPLYPFSAHTDWSFPCIYIKFPVARSQLQTLEVCVYIRQLLFKSNQYWIMEIVHTTNMQKQRLPCIQ